MFAAFFTAMIGTSAACGNAMLSAEQAQPKTHEEIQAEVAASAAQAQQQGAHTTQVLASTGGLVLLVGVGLAGLARRQQAQRQQRWSAPHQTGAQ